MQNGAEQSRTDQSSILLPSTLSLRSNSPAMQRHAERFNSALSRNTSMRSRYAPIPCHIITALVRRRNMREGGRGWEEEEYRRKRRGEERRGEEEKEERRRRGGRNRGGEMVTDCRGSMSHRTVSSAAYHDTPSALSMCQTHYQCVRHTINVSDTLSIYQTHYSPLLPQMLSPLLLLILLQRLPVLAVL